MILAESPAVSASAHLRSSPGRRLVHFPQPVDDPCVRHCGPAQRVTIASTNGERRVSTRRPQTRGKTRGRRCGWMRTTSYGRPSVDGRTTHGWPYAQVIHARGLRLSRHNATYPQVPHHRRRRLVISSRENPIIIGVWTPARPDSPRDPARIRATRHDRIENLWQEAVA